MSVFRASRVAILALLLHACAGGSETGTGLNNGSGGKDMSVGTITKFGSVWVNGVEFETTATQVKLEGASAPTTALKLGMVVTVKGKINADGISGIADTILAEEVIKGPISAMGTNSFTVLGQDIVVNEATRFEDNLMLNALAAGDLIEVSGIVKSAGVITATRVERKTELTEYKLMGVVSSLMPGAHTFMIGGLTVNYANVELPSGVPADGSLVEVKGTLDGGALVATGVKVQALEVADADKFEIEGYIDSVSGGGMFTVNHVNVQTSAATQFKAGLITDLVAGAFVEIEGSLQGGVVTATNVEFREPVKLEADVATNIGNTLTLGGLDSLAVTINSETEYEGEVTGPIGILPGVHVAVRGRYNAGTHQVIATRIEVQADSDPKVVLQGPVDVLANPSLTLMGLSVDTTGIVEFEADGVNDRDSFFAAVTVGDIVNLSGTLPLSGVVNWESIELEN